MAGHDNNNNTPRNVPDNAPEELLDPTRRNLLRRVGLVGAVAVSGGATHSVLATDAAPAADAAQAIPAREALEVLTALEADTLEVICDLLIPSDANGPGAREARAVHYIDRSLASHNAADRERYRIGLNAINEYARKTRGSTFPELDTAQQATILQAVQDDTVTGFEQGASRFFSMVRGHTIDGTFCDPYYGGNRQFVGWDLLRYPGVRLGASEADVALGANLPPNHQSAYDHATYVKTASYMGDDEHAN